MYKTAPLILHIFVVKHDYHDAQAFLTFLDNFLNLNALQLSRHPYLSASSAMCNKV